MIASGFACYNRIITDSFSDLEEVLFSLTTFSIAILSTLSFFSLILKNRKSVALLSSLLLLMIITISISILISIFIIKDFGISKTDYFAAFAVYSVLFGVLYVVRKFKVVQYENIDLIGQET